LLVFGRFYYLFAYARFSSVILII